MTHEERSPRSLLYVPATRPAWVPKAWAADADAVILDLEDSVPLEQRASARENARVALAEHAASGPDAGQLWVRVDPATLREDLAAVVGPGLHGVVVAKAEPAVIADTAGLLDHLEEERGLPARRLRVIALVETARGIQQLAVIAGSPRVSRLALGEADLAGELGIDPDDRRTELLPLRLAIVTASAAAGLERPIGPVHTALDDLEGLERSTFEQLRQGFRARTAVHPSQVDVINRVFTPSDEDVAQARSVLAAFEGATAAGDNAARGPQGQLLDPATVRGARDVLARARSNPMT